MAHEEAAFSRQHSAVSENQHQNQKRFTTEDTEATEGGKTLRIHGKPAQMNADEQERVRQQADALVRRIGEACDELERLAEENPELVSAD